MMMKDLFQRISLRPVFFWRKKYFNNSLSELDFKRKFVSVRRVFLRSVCVFVSVCLTGSVSVCDCS